MSRVAVIDIGTNTTKLQIAEIHGDQFTNIRNDKIATQIGKGAINDNIIQKEAIERLIQAIIRFKEICLFENCSDIMAFATAMMRNAKNGQQVAEQVHDETGIAIQIISGDEEADLIYTGVSACITSAFNPFLIMDIGGGSTEFILVNSNGTSWKRSFSFGATTLLEKFNVSDPITATQLTNINEYLDKELSELWNVCKDLKLYLVGSSGSFESISEMIAYRFKDLDAYNSENSNRSEIDQIEKLFQEIVQSTRAERKAMRGLPEFRLDTIVTALITLKKIQDNINLNALISVPYSLKEGAIIKYYKETAFA